MASSENQDFIALKQALRLYAQQCAALPRVAEEFIARRAASLPRLVQVRHPEDPTTS